MWPMQEKDWVSQMEGLRFKTPYMLSQSSSSKGACLVRFAVYYIEVGLMWFASIVWFGSYYIRVWFTLCTPEGDSCGFPCQ